MRKNLLIGFAVGFYILISSSLVFAAGMKVFIKSDLSHIRIPLDRQSDNFYALEVENGVALWIKNDEAQSGFFTYEALAKMWEEKQLELSAPLCRSEHYPPGLKRGLFLVIWEEEAKSGIVFPVLFDSPGAGSRDSKGNYWYTGKIFVDNQAIGRKPYWHPQKK